MAKLPLDVLTEVVREGEATLCAQLTVSMAADQRAVAFSSVVLAGATAVLGGIGVMVYSSAPDWAMVVVASILAAGLICAGALGIYTARPSQFCLPGNEPKNWTPANWGRPSEEHDMKGARIEQSTVLQSLITRNREASTSAAQNLRRAIIVAFGSIATVAILLAGIILGRVFN